MEIVVLPGDRFHSLVLAHVEMIVFRNFAVILVRLQTIGLGIGCAEWYVADLQQFRRRKEDHVCRIVEDGIDQTTFVDADGLEPRFLCLDRACQPGGTAANNDHIRPHVAAPF